MKTTSKSKTKAETQIKAEKKVKAKERILIAAFKLYLQNEYDKVTLVEIEKETGLTRGSIFYHFRDMDDIFNQMVDRFVFSAQSLENKMKLIGVKTLKEFIEIYVQSVESTLGYLGKLSEGKSIGYFRLIFRAQSFFPNFREKSKAIFNLEIQSWNTIIQKAVDNHEIRSDIDINMTISKFRYAYLGMTYEESLESGLVPANLLKLMMYMYDEIKV
jgi:AcrR family transcriptional regulator